MTHERKAIIYNAAIYNYTTQCSKRNTPNYATHGNTYTILFYPRQAPSHKHLHKTHKRKEKRSCDFPSCRPTARPLPSSCLAPARAVGSLARVARGSDPRLVLSLSLRLGPQRRGALSLSLHTLSTKLPPEPKSSPSYASQATHSRASSQALSVTAKDTRGVWKV